MPSTISPNMGLIIPTVGQEPGPAWANDLNSDLGILDQHDHSAGQGNQITPNGININSDLAIQGNNLTTVKTVRFTAQLASLPGTTPNLGAIYVAGNELYYNDEVGNVVPITNNGSVNAGAGSITGLPSGTASASYSSGTQTFVWQSATSTAANMDNGSVTIREVLAGANGVKLSSPTSLAASYELFFPAALPGTTKFLTLDTSGNIGASVSYPLTGGDIASNTITNTNIANGAISGTKLTDQTVSVSKLVPMTVSTTVGIDGFAASGSIISFSTNSTGGLPVTNSSITITTSGRPVMFALQGTLTSPGNDGSISLTGSITNMIGTIRLFRNATTLSGYAFTNNTVSSSMLSWPSSIQWIDYGLPAGTYTYNLDARVNSASVTVNINNAVVVAYEI